VIERARYAWLPVVVLASTVPAAATQGAASGDHAVTRQFYAVQTSSTSVGEVDAPAAATALSDTVYFVPRMTEAQLWNLARLHDVALPDRVAALGELAERGDPHLLGYIVNELSARALNPAWRQALLLAAERAPLGSVDAKSLSTTLMRHVVALDAIGGPESKPAIWAALRRIGSVADSGVLTVLLPLLASTDMQTRQATLQAITAIARAASHQGAEEVSQRMLELARKYLDADWLVSGPNIAMAANAVRAAVATNGVSVRDEFTVRIREIGRPALERLCRDALAGL
jgi:hypothetical protein